MSLKISVITPSFQQGIFIERTIQSVLSQNIDNLEYVICDGGSQDETLGILKKYEGKIRWISELDDGQSDAINKGIQMTDGDIIAWLNSDDIYYPQALQTVRCFFEENPSAQVVYGQADWINEFDQVLQKFPTQAWDYNRLIDDCFLCQPAVFFRRKLLDSVGSLNTQLHYCMDYELWLRFGKSGTEFFYIPQKLAGSRMYATNKTLGQRLPHHTEVLDMLKSVLGRIPDSWLIGFSQIKVEETTELDKFNDLHLRAFTYKLIQTIFEEYRSRGQDVSVYIMAKMLFWYCFPKYAWFRKRNASDKSALLQWNH